MGALGDLIQSYIDGQAFPPSDAALARRLNVSRTTIGNWKRGEAMPKPHNLRDLSRLIGVAYTRVLDAAMADAGYLTKELGHEAATTTAAGSAPADLDEYNEEAQRILAMPGLDRETRARMLADVAEQMLGRSGDPDEVRSVRVRPDRSARAE